MELVPADIPISFEVTFSSDDLPVAMSVYDTTGVSSVLVQGPSAMSLVYGNTYTAKFTATNLRNYVIIKAVYLDNSFTILDTNYSQGSESIFAQNQTTPAGSSDCAIVGIVVGPDAIVGIVDGNDTINGTVQC